MKVIRSFFLTLAFVVVIAIPIAFFVFGWKDIELQCQRLVVENPPTCLLRESFAMGLYTRLAEVKNIQRIGYRSSSSRKFGTRGISVPVYASTVVFDTLDTEAVITHSVGGVAEKDLILKTRTFLENSSSLQFKHHANLRSIFGYVGLVGTAIILLLTLEVLRYNLIKWIRA